MFRHAILVLVAAGALLSGAPPAVAQPGQEFRDHAQVITEGINFPEKARAEEALARRLNAPVGSAFVKNPLGVSDVLVAVSPAGVPFGLAPFNVANETRLEEFSRALDRGAIPANATEMVSPSSLLQVRRSVVTIRLTGSQESYTGVLTSLRHESCGNVEQETVSFVPLKLGGAQPGAEHEAIVRLLSVQTSAWAERASVATSGLFAESSVGAGGGPDPTCVANCNTAYNIAVATANATLNACISGAQRNYIICVSACTVGACIHPNPWAYAACVAACTGLYTNELIGCQNQHNITMTAALLTWNACVQACPQQQQPNSP